MTRIAQMSVDAAATLLEALLLRLRFSKEGTIRIDEVEGRAIEMLLERAQFNAGLATPATGESPTPSARAVPHAQQFPRVDLDLSSADAHPDTGPDARLCIDFGTAFTKAYAMRGWSDPVDLDLGSYAGSDNPLMVESSIWIDDHGIFFGHDAVARSDAHFEAVQESEIGEAMEGRRRLDSMKSSLVRMGLGPVDALVGNDVNPRAGEVDFTEAELLTLYLAYVSYLVGDALEGNDLPRRLPRRITRPCWEGDSGARASSLLRALMAKAIIVADTLGADLHGGLDVRKAAAVLAAVDALDDDVIDNVMDAMLQEDLSEPEAVAAPYEAEKDWHFLTVVDVGAGTSDVATFLLRCHPNWERGKIMLVPGTRASLDKAGDEIDQILFREISQQLSDGLSEGETIGMEGWLRGKIRDAKVELFRDGIVEAAYRGAAAVVDLDDFLELEEVKHFESALKSLLDGSFAGMPKLMAERVREKGGVRLLLSGGGAGLPMAVNLADHAYQGSVGTIRVRLTNVRPEWESSKDEAFQEIYPQLAVAVGGASPFLPISA